MANFKNTISSAQKGLEEMEYTMMNDNIFRPDSKVDEEDVKQFLKKFKEELDNTRKNMQSQLGQRIFSSKRWSNGKNCSTAACVQEGGRRRAFRTKKLFLKITGKTVSYCSRYMSRNRRKRCKFRRTR